MTRAPIAQQRSLIELQALDSHLARLAHERRALPVLTQIQGLVSRLKENRRAAVLADAAAAEAGRAATRAEDEVGQVVHRAEALRHRLHAGGTSPKDLAAIQGELDQLARRQSALEDAQLRTMEAQEDARRRVNELAAAESEIRAGGRELTAKRDAAFSRIDAEAAEARERRELVAATIEAPLLADYDAVRAATGGLGVVALYGNRVAEGAVEIGPQEKSRIQAAPLDEVLHAEENEVIVVRMPEGTEA